MFQNHEETLAEKSKTLAQTIEKFEQVLPKHLIVVIDPEDDLALAVLNGRIINTRIEGPKGEKIKILKNIILNGSENKAKLMAVQRTMNFIQAVLLSLTDKKALKEADKKSKLS